MRSIKPERLVVSRYGILNAGGAPSIYEQSTCTRQSDYGTAKQSRGIASYNRKTERPAQPTMTTPPTPTLPKWRHVTLAELTPGRFVLRFAVSHVALDARAARTCGAPDYVVSGQTFDEAIASGQAVEDFMERNYK